MVVIKGNPILLPEEHGDTRSRSVFGKGMN
jgi:hypothetical protein